MEINPLETPPEEQRFSVRKKAVEEAHRHKWIESEREKRDLGYAAIRDWHEKYWRIFRRQCWIEHMYGEKYWIELDHHNFGVLKNIQMDTMIMNSVLERLKQGGENLDIINWAKQENIPDNEIIRILTILNVNSSRISPDIDMENSESFVTRIRSNHHATALVVDNNETDRSVISNITQSQGFHVVSASTAEDAMKHAATSRFDLFLIELCLPKRHGAEVAWYLQNHGVRAPVAAISTTFIDWNRDDLMDCGFTDFIEKPVNMSTFEGLTRKALRLFESFAVS